MDHRAKKKKLHESIVKVKNKEEVNAIGKLKVTIYYLSYCIKPEKTSPE